MAELGEAVQIERGVAASLPCNGRKRRTLPPPWVEAMVGSPPTAANFCTIQDRPPSTLSRPSRWKWPAYRLGVALTRQQADWLGSLRH